MNYYLYKLAFDTAVHFGPASSAQSLYMSEDHFCADTLFSALCHTALSLRGQAGLDALIRAAKAGQLLLSDGMPWLGEALYLPKPVLSSRSDRELPAAKRKAVKNLRWIPMEDLPGFLGSIRGESSYDADRAQVSFGISTSTSKVQIRKGEDSLPFQVGLFRFQENAGLWFLAGCGTDAVADLLRVLIEGLALSGIGGKTSAGLGKFHVVDAAPLNGASDEPAGRLRAALEDSSAPKQILLSTSLPGEEELSALLPDAEYLLTRRSGFVQSSTYAEEGRRKITQLFLSAGSVLPGRYEPVLYEVGEAGRHPVYRLSTPLFLGVRL